MGLEGSDGDERGHIAVLFHLPQVDIALEAQLEYDLVRHAQCEAERSIRTYQIIART